MPECKACKAWFASVMSEELCPVCERALKRLEGYAAPVRHGRRIDYGGFYCRCSQCEGTLPVCSNYCPNCGARMDGAGNGEEED